MTKTEELFAKSFVPDNREEEERVMFADDVMSALPDIQREAFKAGALAEASYTPTTGEAKYGIKLDWNEAFAAYLEQEAEEVG